MKTDVQKNGVMLTPSQQKVIDHKSGNMLVSASAGSGKTSTLIAKIVDILTSQTAKVKDMLIVTFTRSASEEIKQRLQAEIMRSKSPQIQEQLDDLSVSDILTFDAFCKKVVEEFGYEVGIQSGFGVADTALANYLKNTALDKLIARHKNVMDEDFVSAIKTLYDKRSDQKFKNIILRMYDFVISHNGFDYYQNQLDKVFDDLKNSPAILQLSKRFCKAKLQFEDALCNLSLQCQMAQNQKSQQTIDKIRAMIEPFGGNFFDNLDYYCTQYKTVAISQTGDADFVDMQLAIKDQYDKFKSELKEDFDAFKGKSYAELLADSKQDKRILLTLLKLAKQFDAEYKLAKQKYQVLDFVDLEEYALQILQNIQIAKDLQNKYKFIFIDEYQDTSDLQNQIIDKITSGDNLLMVGDVKQSIYRYRNAEPQIFINKYHFFGDDAKNMLIELNENFRSEKKILHFANFVFDNIMRSEIDGIDYRTNAQLKFGGNILSNNNIVDVILLQKEKSEKQDAPFQYYSVKDSPLVIDKSTNIQNEATVLAQKIAEAVAGKTHFDAKKNAFVPTTFGDIAVLCRDNKNVILQVRNILNSFGIPVKCKFEDDLSSSIDIQLVIAILKTIQNFQDDIPLLIVMTSIVGGFSFDEIVAIRQFSTSLGNSQNSFLFDAVRLYKQNNDDAISQKIEKFLQKIEFYRIASQSHDICELVQFVVKREGLDLYFWANGKGKQFDEHLRLFFANFQSIKDNSLSEFINYIDNFAGELKVKNEISDGEDSVTISTIHASKGLEYPIVFLLQAGKTFSNTSKKGEILYDNKLGFAIKSTDAEDRTQYVGPIYTSFKAKIDDEQKKDEKRLLYVALTRAKNNLTVIGSGDIQKMQAIKTDSDVTHANSYMSWIFGSLETEDLTMLKNKGKMQKQIDGAQINFAIVAKDDFVPLQPKIQNVGRHDAIKSQTFQKIINAKFEHCALAKKNSVTQIMQQEHYNISNFSAYKQDSTGDDDFLAIGTAYHKFMQNIDFLSDDFEKQIEHMIANGTISQFETTLVDSKKIVTASNQISKMCNLGDKILKEQQFLCYFPANMMVKTDEIQKILVQGVADVLIVKQNEIVLIDYKTSRLNVDKDFVARYSTQLSIYARAIESFYGLPVKNRYIYSFHLDKLISI